ncbi:hypothetical protein [Oceanicella actignis]|uniref:hypothetical protein n=1 Tax=Oceanicella actignis TaxID=1189325 RepID=UPI0011E6AEE2|nr:hypothetical protein [Oceanicella actignis]TYO90899.1 hypothetical protein LY05_01035 [Oceanicella actignis]
MFLGAGLIAAALATMHQLNVDIDAMEAIAPAGAWYVLAALLSPIGYVIQDTVADAMTVAAAPVVDAGDRPLPEAQIKVQHSTMQTLGRAAIIFGPAVVALLNIAVFDGVETMSAAQKTAAYARI